MSQSAQSAASDLAARTKHFRESLIEEFRLSESDTCSAFEAPRHSSSIYSQPDVLEDVLRHKPHSLVKFKIFKRTPECEEAPEAPKLIRMATRKPGRLQRAPRSLPLHEWAKWLSRHKNFSSFVIYTIILNAIVLGIQTSMDEVEDWRTVQILELLDNCTMVIFVWEILLKWIANFRTFWKDGWNVFDFLVTAGVLVPMLAEAAMGSEDQSNAQNFASVAKNLRIFRTFRTLKMIAKFRSLRIIVRTVVEALQSLGFVLILLCLLMYIFAVLAIGLFSDYTNATVEGLTYQFAFSDMIAAVRTLFQLLTLDQWYNIAKEISSVGVVNNIITISFFVVWVALGAFIFRNIFIGVMVKNFQSISQELADLDQISRKRARMRKYVEDFQHQMEEKKREIEQQMLQGRNQLTSSGKLSPKSAPAGGAGSNITSPIPVDLKLQSPLSPGWKGHGPVFNPLNTQDMFADADKNGSSSARPRVRKSFAIPKAWIDGNNGDNGQPNMSPLEALAMQHRKEQNLNGHGLNLVDDSQVNGEKNKGTSPVKADHMGAGYNNNVANTNLGVAGAKNTVEQAHHQNNDQLENIALKGSNAGKQTLDNVKRELSKTPRWAQARLDQFYNAEKAEEWKIFVQQSLTVFGEQDGGSTLWPRDTLLEYLQTMEKLQENIKEHHELQHLANTALYSIATDG